MQIVFRIAACTLTAVFCLTAGIANAQPQITRDTVVVASASTAVTQWRAAANRGVSSAQYLMGLYYSRGQGGLRRDYIKAYKWFRVSADSHPGSRKSLEVLSKKMGRVRFPSPRWWRATGSKPTANKRQSA